MRAKLAAPLSGDIRDLGSQPVPDPTDLASADAALAGVPTGEESLLGLAQAWTVDEFNQFIKGFTVIGDPVAQEKAFQDAVEKEYLLISPTLGGSVISGFVTTEHAQEITAALAAVAGVPAAGERADPGGCRRSSRRTGGQRSADGRHRDLGAAHPECVPGLGRTRVAARPVDGAHPLL